MTIVAKRKSHSYTSLYRAVEALALLGLCSAYIQGAVTKLSDHPAAVAEMNHFGLSPAGVFAVGVPLFELAMSAMILSGRFRWLGCLALASFTAGATLIALRFWEILGGQDRLMAMNSFFEHLGLVGAFVFVAVVDLRRP